MQQSESFEQFEPQRLIQFALQSPSAHKKEGREASAKKKKIEVNFIISLQVLFCFLYSDDLKKL